MPKSLLSAQIPLDVIMQARKMLPPDDPAQKVLAAMDHRAFARELTSANPLNAIWLAAAIPGYQVAKLAGLDRSTASAPSWQQLAQGYMGVWEGLKPRRIKRA
jgi:hypothetical protein